MKRQWVPRARGCFFTVQEAKFKRLRFVLHKSNDVMWQVRYAFSELFTPSSTWGGMKLLISHPTFLARSDDVDCIMLLEIMSFIVSSFFSHQAVRCLSFIQTLFSSTLPHLIPLPSFLAFPATSKMMVYLSRLRNPTNTLRRSAVLRVTLFDNQELVTHHHALRTITSFHRLKNGYPRALTHAHTPHQYNLQQSKWTDPPMEQKSCYW